MTPGLEGVDSKGKPNKQNCFKQSMLIGEKSPHSPPHPTPPAMTSLLFWSLDSEPLTQSVSHQQWPRMRIAPTPAHLAGGIGDRRLCSWIWIQIQSHALLAVTVASPLSLGKPPFVSQKQCTTLCRRVLSGRALE